MIWISLGIYLVGFAVLAWQLYRLRQEIKSFPSIFPPIPDCKFKESESKCLYSPGSEPERICVLREEDKKRRDQKIPDVIPAPRWIDRNPPGE